eukprot:TRINITY_DN106033_c0_g1_i1.p1 TRINITY_DN106033_c0_g1~~TRINITY_DN106033_c0_g1_i1.p1  ORF type:complete len:385 (-),score=30.76 TRINITY_DN106033_c0_g1_i1:364-1518(-)
MSRIIPWHPGLPRTLQVSGFGFSEWLFNGEYDILAASGNQAHQPRQPTWKKRSDVALAWINFSHQHGRWMLSTSKGQLILARHAKASPAGGWEKGISVTAFFQTPSPLAMMAFPCPEQSLEFYMGTKTNSESKGRRSQALLQRPDLIFLETTEGEQIPAVHKRYPGTSLTLLYSHGNAEDLGISLDYIDVLSNFCRANILAYEYVGYSLSRLEGFAPSEARCYQSIDAAWRYLTLDLGLRPWDIVLYGRSIGSGPTVDLASRAPATECAGVILQCPIASAGRCVFGTDSPVTWLAQSLDMFVNVDKIAEVHRPVAIMHGTKDDVVSCANGEELYDLLQKPFDPLWLKGYGHNNMPIRECANYMACFLDYIKAEVSWRTRSSWTM